MWCIYFLFASLLALYCLVVAIAYGIRVNIRADYDNLSVCARVYLFDWIEIFSLNVFVCDGKFYYAFNKKEFKTVSAKKSADKNIGNKDSKVREVNTDYAGFLKEVMRYIPEIYVRRADIEYSLGKENCFANAMAEGVIDAVKGIASSVRNKKIDIGFLYVADISDRGDFKGAKIDFSIGFSLVKILLFGMHIIKIKRKHASVKYA